MTGRRWISPAFGLAAPRLLLAGLAAALLASAGVALGLVFDLGPLGAYDKPAHIIYFFLLTLILARGFGIRLFWALMLAVALGTSGELVQGFLPKHETSLQDMAANLMGIAVAAAVIVLPVLLSKRSAPSLRS